MKIRSFLPSLLCLLLITSCKNKENQDDSLQTHESQETYEPQSSTRDEERTSTQQGQDEEGVRNLGESGKNDRERDKTAPSPHLSEGNYIKEGESDENCDCFCIEVNFTEISELCLKEDAIFITSRMSRENDGLINIYFEEPSSRSSEGEDIPWEDFDKEVPIATISATKNGNLELDWLGFTINGDLAMDYAIYGKKTLEGTYKKK